MITISALQVPASMLGSIPSSTPRVRAGRSRKSITTRTPRGKLPWDGSMRSSGSSPTRASIVAVSARVFSRPCRRSSGSCLPKRCILKLHLTAGESSVIANLTSNDGEPYLRVAEGRPREAVLLVNVRAKIDPSQLRTITENCIREVAGTEVREDGRLAELRPVTADANPPLPPRCLTLPAGREICRLHPQSRRTSAVVSGDTSLQGPWQADHLASRAESPPRQDGCVLGTHAAAARETIRLAPGAMSDRETTRGMQPGR